MIQILPCDGRNYKFTEYLDKQQEFYFYTVEVKVKKEGHKAVPANVFITSKAVAVRYDEGGAIGTNIIPSRIFKNQKTLNWKQIAYFIILLENIGLEGVYYSHQEDEALMEMLGGPIE